MVSFITFSLLAVDLHWMGESKKKTEAFVPAPNEKAVYMPRAKHVQWGDKFYS